MRYALGGKLFAPEVNSQIVNVSRGQEVTGGRHGHADRCGGDQEAVHKASGGQVPGADGAVHSSSDQPAAVRAERLANDDIKRVDGLDGQRFMAM